MSSDEPWQPDWELVHTVRTRRVAITELTGPDRAFVVAALTVRGWTVAAIAGQLVCSLRLVQQIKAEPMTRLAVWAIGQTAAYERAQQQHAVEQFFREQQLAVADTRCARLQGQLDILLARTREESRNGRHGDRGGPDRHGRPAGAGREGAGRLPRV